MKWSEVKQKPSEKFAYRYSPQDILSKKDQWQIHKNDSGPESFKLQNNSLAYSTKTAKGGLWIHGNQAWKKNINGSYTLEIRMKIKGSKSGNAFKGCSIIPRNGRSAYWVNIYDDGVSLGTNGKGQVFENKIDNSSGMHSWRIAWDEGSKTGYLWRDGKLVSKDIRVNDSRSARDLVIGDGSSRYASGAVEIEYVRFETGIWAP